MKSVAVTGTRGCVPGVAFMDTKEAMRRVGNNCGNLVFQYATCGIIRDKIRIVGQDVPWDAKKVRDKCRVVVVPSANFLREGFDFSGFVDFLEKTELPLVFVGLGAQANDVYKKKFDFHPSVERLISIMKERCAAVSVRGEYTASVLEGYGIHGSVVTGCPSNFINKSPDLGAVIGEKLKKPLRSFIAHTDEPWPKVNRKKEVERKLFGWSLSGSGITVQQAVPTMIQYLRLNNAHSAGDVRSGFGKALANALAPGVSLETFEDFCRTRLRTYFSVDQWLEDSAAHDFSVGLRLHGNMVAWQAGTPALWITHDSRTKELVETMALPNISIEDFMERCETVDDARVMAENSFDKNLYNKRREHLSGQLLRVFDACGVRYKKTKRDEL
ncbi:MAG: polysaccharide pyruvyl transferase family protein [Ectothiorhodospiraceae bacterium]|nr:polysaccharide pyruvyl transferase family protein [Ectothiorhodospiraceae bacterium]